jgi:hypothetical protein
LQSRSLFENRVTRFPASYQDTEDFVTNPEEYLSSKDAETIIKHSSLQKRFKSSSLEEDLEINNLLIATPFYELLNE